ncbi:MAG: hypothetical protein DRG87_06575 [Deltaproteobacteria bacterium]|nr:hypothetical protein [Deltaproteobacteria bacterium]MBW2078648.1 hypothetical protein [Deltaproteobacteria bacterium]MBW2312423.1 hypothetical protein [Deltaproteobacteria bacterium]RLB29713.1 MAG: hypothetical protein DRG87_06575 [Deltaproteobacteria bacterium]
MRTLVIPIVFIAILASTTSFAGMYDLEIHASRSDLEARFNADLPLDKAVFSTGLGVLYRDDDYKLADIKLTLGKELLAPALRVSIGLKGVLGNVERDQKEGDVMAVGVLAAATYPIPQTISPLPVEVSAGVSFAPGPFRFSDSERYLELRTGLDFRVVENGAIILGYRHIHARLDNSYGRWKISDSVLFVGYRLNY